MQKGLTKPSERRRVGNNPPPPGDSAFDLIMGNYIYQVILHSDEDGGFWVDVPCLPGCVSDGRDYIESVSSIADAMKTYVAALIKDGMTVPESIPSECPDDCESVYVYFETDERYIIEGEVVSAAEASRLLDVSPGRVSQMIDAGQLDAYREGRRTYVSVESIEKRIGSNPGAGRPKKIDR